MNQKKLIKDYALKNDYKCDVNINLFTSHLQKYKYHN